MKVHNLTWHWLCVSAFWHHWRDKPAYTGGRYDFRQATSLYN